MRTEETKMENKMLEVAQRNKRLSEPLKQAMAEVERYGLYCTLYFFVKNHSVLQ